LRKIIFTFLALVFFVIWQNIKKTEKTIQNTNIKHSKKRMNKNTLQKITETQEQNNSKMFDDLNTESENITLNYTRLDEEVFLVQKPEFKVGEITYKTWNDGPYRILRIKNRNVLITKKVFIRKKDLETIKRIFPENKIEEKNNYISVEIKFEDLKKTYNSLKKEKIKFNHEFLRRSPIPL
tara:strand:+ start:2759 stop:3301 length:543 start_codon:yes stop_codon:yes gene_type:complete